MTNCFDTFYFGLYTETSLCFESFARCMSETAREISDFWILEFRKFFTLRKRATKTIFLHTFYSGKLPTSGSFSYAQLLASSKTHYKFSHVLEKKPALRLLIHFPKKTSGTAPQTFRSTLAPHVAGPARTGPSPWRRACTGARRRRRSRRGTRCGAWTSEETADDGMHTFNFALASFSGNFLASVTVFMRYF